MPDRTKYSDFNRVVEIDNIQYEEEGTYECTAKRKSSVASKEVVLAIECTSKLLYHLSYMPVKQVRAKHCVGKRKIASLFEDIALTLVLSKMLVLFLFSFFFLMILHLCCMKPWTISVLLEIKFRIVRK